MLSRDLSCDILVRWLLILSCANSLPEAKVKSFGLIPLVEEITKQPRLCCVVFSVNSNEEI